MIDKAGCSQCAECAAAVCSSHTIPIQLTRSIAVGSDVGVIVVCT